MGDALDYLDAGSGQVGSPAVVAQFRGGVAFGALELNDLGALAQGLDDEVRSFLRPSILVNDDVQDLLGGVDAVRVHVGDAGLDSLVDDGIQTGSGDGVHEDDVVALVDGLLDLLSLKSGVVVRDEAVVLAHEAGFLGGVGSLSHLLLVHSTIGVALDDGVVGSDLEAAGGLRSLAGRGVSAVGDLSGGLRRGSLFLAAAGGKQQADHHHSQEYAK